MPLLAVRLPSLHYCWGSKLRAATLLLATRRSAEECRRSYGYLEWQASSGQGAGHTPSRAARADVHEMSRAEGPH